MNRNDLAYEMAELALDNMDRDAYIELISDRFMSIPIADKDLKALTTDILNDLDYEDLVCNSSLDADITLSSVITSLSNYLKNPTNYAKANLISLILAYNGEN